MTNRILAIKCGVSEMAYAVLDGSQLMVFGTRRFSSVAGRESRALRFLGQLGDGFSPDVLVIEPARRKPLPRAELLSLSELFTFAKGRGLSVRIVGRLAMRRLIASNETATRCEVAEAVVQWFPYLERYLRIDRRTGRGYWTRVLEAIALGLAANEEIQKARVLRALRGS